ncbi:unnamed protein product, partial [Didymodactylos carnosus]
TMEKVIVVSALLSKMNFTWYNEPKKWSSNGATINVHTDGNTDFWRKTHYGFERDSGHFYYQSLPGDHSFTATVNIRGNYHTLYDQGGLMLRTDEKNWIKCGVEYVDDQQFASVVVTVNGWSDWSVVSIKAPEVLKLRVRRVKEAVHIEFAEGEEGDFKMMRLAYLPVIDNSQAMMVGIMCASPVEDAEGFDISFEGLTIVENPYTSESVRNSTNLKNYPQWEFFQLRFLKVDEDNKTLKHTSTPPDIF